jgi:hypothetical protein
VGPTEYHGISHGMSHEICHLVNGSKVMPLVLSHEELLNQLTRCLCHISDGDDDGSGNDAYKYQPRHLVAAIKSCLECDSSPVLDLVHNGEKFWKA